MKKIKDERLILKNLKNIRGTYIIQTIGIFGILGYDLITKGMDEMTKNPLWFVFLISFISSMFFSMDISVSHESSKKSPKRRFIFSMVIIAFISIGVGFLVPFTGKFGAVNGLITAGIFFICFLIPNICIYFIRIKQQD